MSLYSYPTRQELLNAAAGLVNPTQLACGMADVMMLAAGKVPEDIQDMAVHDPIRAAALMGCLRVLMAQSGNQESPGED